MLPKDQGSRLPDLSSPRSRCHALSSFLPQTQKPGPPPHIHDSLLCGLQLPPAQPPSQQDPWATGLGDARESHILVLRLGCRSQDGNGTGGNCRDDGQKKDTKLGRMPHRPDQTRQTGIWGQMMRSLASDKHDLGAQTNGSLRHKLTGGQLAPGLTGDLQSDPMFLDPFRYTVVGLTAEPRPMVFWPHDHH